MDNSARNQLPEGRITMSRPIKYDPKAQERRERAVQIAAWRRLVRQQPKEAQLTLYDLAVVGFCLLTGGAMICVVRLAAGMLGGAS